MRRITENQKSVDYQLRPDRDLTILIPARAGSKRIPGKNTKRLGGKPLIQWTIDAARAAQPAAIIVSSDDLAVHLLAFDANCLIHQREPDHATDTAPDYLWIHDLRGLIQTKYFAICRPTSPFRTASTIRRGYAALVGSGAHSIRAVEPVTHPHPGKMWICHPGSRFMDPLLSGDCGGTPYHSCPTQILPTIYRQNASLEMAQTWVIDGTQTISGHLIAPFLTDPVEGVDLNTPEDWERAEQIAAQVVETGYGHGV